MTTDNKNKHLSYKESGVDVEAGYKLVKRIQPFVEKTRRPEVLTGLGSFSALSRIPNHIKNPVLVTCTDGVGTKIEIARELNEFSTIGIDLVAMCVNDLIACGAEPLVFLDYYVTDKLRVEIASKVIEGIASGCEQANCSLVGGETAEHPGSFPKNSFDLAGFSVGIVDENEIIGQDDPKIGDILIGIESSGFHSNGYSLLRKVIRDYEVNLKSKLKGEEIGEILLKPTRIYVDEILSLKKSVVLNSIAHITGGGFIENIPRMLGENQKAVIEHAFDDWPKGYYFEWLTKMTDMPKENLLNTFNCGVGMVIAVNESDAENALGALNQSLFAKKIGRIEERSEKDQAITFI
tara:strand:- start:16595 stop:17644 length:1050 start_codon:yes stop_codon:yes gene_type:complete